jgi:hypothetical protein
MAGRALPFVPPQAPFRRTSIRRPTHSRKALAQYQLSPSETRRGARGLSRAELEQHGGVLRTLFGSKHETSANTRESSVSQPGQAKSQAAPTAPSSIPAQTKATATTRGTPEAHHPTDSKELPAIKTQPSPSQQEQSAEPPPDAEGTRTTNLLFGAMPTVPTGRFEYRFGASH